MPPCEALREPVPVDELREALLLSSQGDRSAAWELEELLSKEHVFVCPPWGFANPFMVVAIGRVRQQTSGLDPQNVLAAVRAGVRLFWGIPPVVFVIQEAGCSPRACQGLSFLLEGGL
jgi:hypothetical protein